MSAAFSGVLIVGALVVCQLDSAAPSPEPAAASSPATLAPPLVDPAALQRFLDGAIHVNEARPPMSNSLLPGTTGRRFVLTASGREVGDFDLRDGVPDGPARDLVKRSILGWVVGGALQMLVFPAAIGLMSAVDGAGLAAAGGFLLGVFLLAPQFVLPALVAAVVAAAAVLLMAFAGAAAVVGAFILLRPKIYAPLDDDQLAQVVRAYNTEVAKRAGIQPESLDQAWLTRPPRNAPSTGAR